jgi:hypothetical protein
MIHISTYPIVIDDVRSETDINAKDDFGDSHTSSAKGILLAVHRDDVTTAFICSSSNIEDGSLQCDLAKTYRTPDESLSFPLHPGDEVEFSFTQIGQQTTISYITVSCYNKLTVDEIERYLNRLQGFDDSMDALVVITSFPAMWRYIVNDNKLPEGVLQKILSLHNSIWQSKKSVLQTSRLERLMQSYVGAKFLDLLYEHIESSNINISIQLFLTGFIKCSPTSAFAVVRHIRCLTQALNKAGQEMASYNFLIEIVTATCIPSKAANVSTLPWDQTPLIITPDELRVLTQAGSEKFAELPVVQTEGAYKDLADYYETYFRLLRDDCFGEVRNLILSARLGQLDKEQHVVYKIIGFTGLHFLINGRGMAYGIKFEASSRVDWTTSDALKCENLVCISPGGEFEDDKMIWATIATQRGSKMDRLNEGELFIQFCTEANERTDANVITLLLESRSPVMVESPTFFRAYYPVLKALQSKDIEETPFQNELLRCKSSGGVDYINERTRVDWSVIFKPVSKSLKKMPYKMFRELDAIAVDRNFQCILDDSQLDALKLAFNHPVAIIQGPPGTGKSYVGTKLIQLLMTMKTLPNGPIIILTYKNRVLDQFLLDCLAFCPANRIVRVGRVGESKLEKRSLSVILHREKLVKRHMARRIHFDSIKRLRELKSKLHRAGRQLEKANQLDIKVIMSQATDRHLESLLTGAKTFSEKDNEIIAKLIKKKNWSSLRSSDELIQYVLGAVTEWLLPVIESQGCVENTRKSTIPSLFRSKRSMSRPDEDRESQESESCGELSSVKIVEQERSWSAHSDENVKNVLGQPKVDEGPVSISFTNESVSDDNQFNIFRCELATDVIASADLEHVSSVWDLNDDHRRLLVQLWLRDHYNSAVKLFVAASTEYNAICGEIQDRNNNIYYEILKNARIVGMTTTGAAIHQQLLMALEPAVVVVEEACEVLEAQLLASLTPSVKHLIMIGDYKQLRPKVACYRLARDHNFDRSMFERLVSNNFPHGILGKQRRMREECTVLLKEHYPALQSHPQVDSNRISPCLRSPLFFWSHGVYEKRSGSGLIVNEHEVEKVTKLVLALLILGEQPGDITVLSPYRAQVHAVTRGLRNCRDLTLDPNIIAKSILVKVCTVDEYQGDENDIIILTLVRSNKRNILGFLKEKNRLVVSVSRQRSCLIIIGNGTFLCKNDRNWKVQISA